MNTYLLDASVILKWFIEDEKLIKQALKLRQSFLDGKIDLILFKLSYLEVVNILSCKKQITAVQIKNIISALDLLNVSVQEIDLPTLKRAVDFSKKYQLSVYDAAYIALAEKFKVKFITCDEKMFRKVKKNLTFVELLEQFN